MKSEREVRWALCEVILKLLLFNKCLNKIYCTTKIYILQVNFDTFNLFFIYTGFINYVLKNDLFIYD